MYFKKFHLFFLTNSVIFAKIFRNEKNQMVDLQSQYQKIKNEVDEKVLNVMQSAQFINGPEVQNFQKELEQYLGVKHVIPCANGTDALQIALMALEFTTR